MIMAAEKKNLTLTLFHWIMATMKFSVNSHAAPSVSRAYCPIIVRLLNRIQKVFKARWHPFVDHEAVAARPAVTSQALATHQTSVPCMRNRHENMPGSVFIG